MTGMTVSAPTGVDCDVAVVGGGPAGAAAAIAARRAGLAVTVLEQTRYDVPRAGETLSPAARPVLARLGLSMPSERAAVPSFGNETAWGDDVLAANPFVVSPFGNGAHVDRAAFDASLTDAARALGATMLRGRVARCDRDSDRGWVLGAGRVAVSAAGVICATGRRAPLAREAGTRRHVADRLVGVAVEYAGADDGGGPTVVEATRNGWWYTATLPGSRRIVVLMTDADICREQRYHDPVRWENTLADTRHIQALAAGLRPLTAPRVTSAASHRLAPATAPRWLAAGDAAIGVDPLSGSGLVLALLSGEAAGTAMAHWLVGDDGPAMAYERWLDGRFAEYWRARSDYYALETRWRDSPFWRRRR